VTKTLIQPLFEGPLDIVGDVHGEIDALTSLLDRLGYSRDGAHPEGRRLVFVGDLVDRGPDSPAVLRLVMPMVNAGRAQCVLGNHELNLMLGRRKQGNSWYFGEEEPLDGHGRSMPMNFIDDRLGDEFDQFMKTLPLALERDDLRVVHACWHQSCIDAACGQSCARSCFEKWDRVIVNALDRDGVHDPIDRVLARQNQNPVKVLTSGLEERNQRAFEAGATVRHTARTRWWDSYDQEAFVVFGHYWRIPVLGKAGPDPLFDADKLYQAHGRGNSMCIDYSVGGRWLERIRRATAEGRFATHITALRWPGGLLASDRDSTTIPIF